MKRNQAMIKTVLPTSPQQQVLTQSPWKALNKCSIQCFKITIQNQIGRNNNKPPFISQEHSENGLPITYCWSNGITSNFRTTENLANVRKKATNQMELTKTQMGGITERCKVRNK